MTKNLLLTLFAVMALAPAAARAQVPAEELTSPQKTLSCSDLVTAQSAIDSAPLAITGRVIKRDDVYTWFRVYVVQKGEYDDDVLKAAGFYGGKRFVAGVGQSYEKGEVYTVAVRGPENRQEEKFDAEWFNALDACGEAVVSKAHDRYGLFRTRPEQITAAEDEGAANHMYFFGRYYVAFIGFFILAAGWVFHRRGGSFAGLLNRLRGNAG